MRDENYQPLSICRKLSGMVYYYYYCVYHISGSMWISVFVVQWNVTRAGLNQVERWHMDGRWWEGVANSLANRTNNQHFKDKWWEFPMDDDGHLWQSFLVVGTRDDLNHFCTTPWIKLIGLPYHSFLILAMTIWEFWPKTYTYIYNYIYILTQTCTSMYISWIHSTFIHSHPGEECDYFKTSSQNLKNIDTSRLYSCP